MSRSLLRPNKAVLALLVTLFIAFNSNLVSASAPMAQAATDFLQALTAEQKTGAAFALDSEERMKWHFVPSEIFPRQGISLKNLTEEQRTAAQALLMTGLSESGYLTVSAIIELERVLKFLEPNGRFDRDHENYFVSVFGTPAIEGHWGWRFEGHHVSLHFTVVSGNLTVSSPTFLGSNPAEVRSGAQTDAQQGQRVLAAREDSGRALVMTLDEAQKAQAILPLQVPGDIVTGTDDPITALEAQGLRAIEMTAAQQGLLREIVNAYTSVMADDIAETRWEKIQRDGFESLQFVWIGSVERGQPHYYRVQGPSFLIEFDNVQNEGNHIHSVWRDFDGDFGRDLLREHYQQVAH